MIERARLLLKCLQHPNRVYFETPLGTFKKLNYDAPNRRWTAPDVTITRKTLVDGRHKVWYRGWFGKKLVSNEPMTHEILALNGDSVRFGYEIRFNLT